MCGRTVYLRNERNLKGVNVIMAVKKAVENIEAVSEEAVIEKAETKKPKKQFSDTDEIEIQSIIPNVFYDDDKTGDSYHWESAGDVEVMTVDAVKRMYRNHRGYFTSMVLKPVDEAVCEMLGLTKMFKKYEALLTAEYYSRDKIDDICEEIAVIPNSVKGVIYNKINNMVATGEITDIQIIRKLEVKFGLDLISLLG